MLVYSVSVEVLPGGIEEWISNDSPSRPSADFPFLLLEGNLGIPKKVLYSLYMAATALYKRSSSSSASLSDVVPDLKASTSVILLVNPAHQTAMNARKRLIEADLLSPVKELEYTEVLVRGSSDCAKQSILWDHRRWIFRRVYLLINPVLCLSNTEYAGDVAPSAFPRIPPDVIRKELAVARQACERYPRNYHAWTHWRYAMDTVFSALSVPDSNCQDYADIIAEESKYIHHWVEQHISDYSAVHHLAALVRCRENLTVPPPRSFGGPDATSLVDHALSLITSYPSHESLWMYLRVAVSGLSIDRQQDAIDRLKAYLPQSQMSSRFTAWLAVQACFALSPCFGDVSDR